MPDATDRAGAVAAIRRGLRHRSGLAWSVTGGRGTSWGWITITAPPARRDRHGGMAPQDAALLAELLALPTAHAQGVNVPDSGAYYREYVDRAEGRAPAVLGRPHWD